MRRHLILFALVVLPATLLSVTTSAQTATTSVLVSGLRAPVKSIITSKGNLLVAEAGNGPNTGRISIVDANGNRRTLIDGLPSGWPPRTWTRPDPRGWRFAAEHYLS